MTEKPAKPAKELSVKDTRASLADVINDAIQGRTTYITNRGRRVAAIVPISAVEAAEQARPD